MALGRRKRAEQPEAGIADGADVDAEPAPDPGPSEALREGGPWDLAEVDEPGERIDLGSIQVKGCPGLTLQAQVDEKSGRVSLITLVLGDGAVQVQAFAAPRSAGIWDEVRRTLMSSITGSGGLVEEARGRFGTEIRARVPGQGSGLQPARFIGVDGPRWFLRGLFLGSAADPAKAAALEDVFADIIVVRGPEAMAPSEPLPFTLPASAEGPESGDAPADGGGEPRGV